MFHRSLRTPGTSSRSSPWSRRGRARIYDDPAKLATVAEADAPEHAAQLVESILARQKDLGLNLKAFALVDRLWDRAAPSAARVRAQGIFADHLDPQTGAGLAAAITLTGLPVVSAQISTDVMADLWRAVALLLGVGFVVMLAATRKPAVALRSVLEAALASAVTFALAGNLGLGVDPGSLALFLLPAVAAFVASGSSRAALFCVALAAAGSTLLFVGVLPISRIGSVLAVGLAVIALMHFVAHRFLARPAAV